jgi:hypothetical protein
MTDDIATRLREVCMCKGITCRHDGVDLEAADEIERLRSLLAEVLPIVIRDVECGVALGEPPVGHPDDDCEDCKWYKGSLELKSRIDAGEFGGVLK